MQLSDTVRFLASPSAQLASEAFNFDGVTWIGGKFARDQHRSCPAPALLFKSIEFNNHLLLPGLAHSGDALARRDAARSGDHGQSLADPNLARQPRQGATFTAC